MSDTTDVESVLRRGSELGCEVLPGVSKRRSWGPEDKLQILRQAMAPGSSVTLACRAHRISSGQFYTWRQQFYRGELTGFVPVSVAAEPPSLSPVTAVQDAATLPPAQSVGMVEVELPGGIKLRVGGDIEPTALRRLLSALR